MTIKKVRVFSKSADGTFCLHDTRYDTVYVGLQGELIAELDGHVASVWAAGEWHRYIRVTE